MFQLPIQGKIALKDLKPKIHKSWRIRSRTFFHRFHQYSKNVRLSELFRLRKNFVWQFEYVPRFITVLPWIWQTWFLIRIITTLVNKYWIVWIIKSSSIVAKLHLRWNVTSKIITSSGNSWKDYTNWNSRPKICTVSYPRTCSIIMRLVVRLKNYLSSFWYWIAVKNKIGISHRLWFIIKLLNWFKIWRKIDKSYFE